MLGGEYLVIWPYGWYFPDTRFIKFYFYFPQKTSEFFGVGELPPFPYWFKKAGKMMCRRDADIVNEICYNIVFLFGGWNPEQSNKVRYLMDMALTTCVFLDT